jgi:DNA-3-methyladenine glycosylase
VSPELQTLAERAVVDRTLLSDVITAARSLLGCVLVREHPTGVRAGIIVETEAYPHDDPACHAFRGPDTRNRAMFADAGCAYVYRIHRSWCFNVVTGPAGRGEAVLVRAVEPLVGVGKMERARRRASVASRPPRGTELTNGPGKLCEALDIDARFDGAELLRLEPCANGLRLLARAGEPAIRTSRRIGISKARAARLRFFIERNDYVSR